MTFPLVACPKPLKRRYVLKEKARRGRQLTRAQVVKKVWLRDRGLCVRCGVRCVPPKETYPTDPWRGEVHDIVPRSLGGDPLSVANNELLCHADHFNGKSGAHAPRRRR